MSNVYQQLRPRALRRGATVGKTVNPSRSQISLPDNALWRIAREVESISASKGIASRKRKVLALIVTLLQRETGLGLAELLSDNRFLKTRADIYSLTFPVEQFRAEMFAAYEAKNEFSKILWIARGKPKPAWQNEQVISDFRAAMRRVSHVEYTDDELRELFESALRIV